MIGRRFARWTGMALLAVLVPCAGGCSFWERHCAPTQPVCYPPPVCGCAPVQTGFQPVPQQGWTPANGACR